MYMILIHTSMVSIGEGSKPLFQRDDIVVNPDNVVSNVGAHFETQPKDRSNNSKEEVENQWRKERHKSTDSSSPERFRKHHSSNKSEHSNSGNNITTRHTKTHHPSQENLNTASKRRDSSPPTNRRHRTPEKVPYFIDEIRERDRIRRKYGKRSTKSPSPPVMSSKFRRRRSYSRSISRSRSHSPARSKNRTHVYGSLSRRSSSVDRYIGGGRKRRRENLRTERDRDGQYRHHGHRSEEQERSRRGRSPRARTRSRTRSRERSKHVRARNDERNKNLHGNHDELTNAELNQRNLTQPQIITIPVPVPADFLNYAYSTWPTQTQWSHPMTPPPRYGAPAYHMPTILPATVMPPMRPALPPYGLPPQPMRYGGRGLRFPQQHGPRPWRPNFRPKTHK
uniref:Female-specific protein transformer n=1 Tax=Ceratitis capitata TaxID=7213 RepID=W8CBN5_CERCA